jgi:histidinol-phosphate/aromatic aminotransferase/cobyric acid decarboxylase-like protein
MIRPKPYVTALAPYALADLKAPAGRRPLSLAQNESALPPSPRALAAARDALSSARLYPDPDWTDLRAAIARVHDLDPGRILCGGGSMELIACLLQGYAGPGDRVLSSEYGYAFFRAATQAVGADYDRASERDFTVSVDALLAAVSIEGKESLLRETIAFAGAEHLIYATDVPHWDGEFPGNLEEIRDANELSDAEKTAILHDNTKELFSL